MSVHVKGGCCIVVEEKKVSSMLTAAGIHCMDVYVNMQDEMR